MIAGMDWLSRFRDLINCEKKLVMIHDPSEGMLTIYGEGTRFRSAFSSTTWARQCLQHGCMGYLAYVVNMWVERKNSISDVLIVREFPDVFWRIFLVHFSRDRLSSGSI